MLKIKQELQEALGQALRELAPDATVRAMFEAAKTKHEVHLPDRIKTSGMITTVNGSTSNSIILKPGCTELVRIEAELKELLK